MRKYPTSGIENLNKEGRLRTEVINIIGPESGRKYQPVPPGSTNINVGNGASRKIRIARMLFFASGRKTPPFTKITHSASL